MRFLLYMFLVCKQPETPQQKSTPWRSAYMCKRKMVMGCEDSFFYFQRYPRFGCAVRVPVYFSKTFPFRPVARESLLFHIGLQCVTTLQNITKKSYQPSGSVAYILENIASYSDARHSLTFFSIRAATSSDSAFTNFSPTIFS